jgi:hypothetical protein
VLTLIDDWLEDKSIYFFFYIKQLPISEIDMAKKKIRVSIMSLNNISSAAHLRSQVATELPEIRHTFSIAIFHVGNNNAFELFVYSSVKQQITTA